MTRRVSTQIQHYRLSEQVRSVLVLAPAPTWDDILAQVNASKSTISRALRAQGTTLQQERNGALLDRAALQLIGTSARTEKIALLNAARAADYRKPRYMCEPFTGRYGLTPGKIWALGVSARTLRSIAASPAPHSRQDSAAYARRRRSITKHRRRLEQGLRALAPDTVVAREVRAALEIQAGQQQPRGRARPRSRARRAMSSR